MAQSARLASLGLALLALLTLTACGDGAALDRLAAGERGKVVQVNADNALVLSSGLVARLSGVTAPNADEPGGEAAHADLVRLAQGREVELFYGGRRRDLSGRALAQVRLVAGRRWIQQALLNDGAARVRTYADNRALAQPMYAAEAKARRHDRGLWASPVYAVRLPTEMGPDVTGFQIVEGRVVRVTQASGSVYLDFNDERRGFAVNIPDEAAGDLRAAGMAPQTLQGRLIRVRGVVDFRGLMRIDHPEPIEVLKER
jgi:micrococcal nuclease